MYNHAHLKIQFFQLRSPDLQISEIITAVEIKIFTIGQHEDVGLALGTTKTPQLVAGEAPQLWRTAERLAETAGVTDADILEAHGLQIRKIGVEVLKVGGDGLLDGKILQSGSVVSGEVNGTNSLVLAVELLEGW